MPLSDFKFDLPKEKIAKYPANNRDESRMMVLHRSTGDIEHLMFKDVLSFFDEHDVFVFNDTKVFPARLYGKKEKTWDTIEVFLLRELNEEQHLWDVQVEPARKIRIGNKLYFGEDQSLVAEVIDNTTSRGRTLRFFYDGEHDEFLRSLYALGEAPLPEYFRELDRPTEPEDLERFQTIFARHEGAVTAPSTGLHFSRQMMKRLEIKGIELAFLTLHCGVETFHNPEVEDLFKHKMGSEPLFVGPECCSIVNRAKDNGHRIVAVGNTVQRALETCVDPNHHIKEYDGWTSRFIFPPYEFQVADAMLSNFQLPHSTPLMLTSAFGKQEHVKRAYEVALKENYRFGVYGDLMLIID